jgi:hypothetical protein
MEQLPEQQGTFDVHNGTLHHFLFNAPGIDRMLA